MAEGICMYCIVLMHVRTEGMLSVFSYSIRGHSPVVPWMHDGLLRVHSTGNHMVVQGSDGHFMCNIVESPE